MRTRTRVVLWVAGGLAVVLATGAGALAYLNRPLSQAEIDREIEGRLADVVAEDDGVSSALLTVYDGGTGALHQYAVGTTHPGSDEPARVDSRYHSASVGKTMLATVYGQLVDEGVLTFEDTVARWVDGDVLDGLFVVDGVDHADQVTIGQLLAHTSGVADYFEGPVTSGDTLLEVLAADPDHLFTPHELIAFTRDRQVPVGRPGEVFAYSDTGYLLLGLALERIEGVPYDEVLATRLFDELGMTDTSFMTRFGEPSGILALDVDGVDLSARNALSVDWAGGGVVTTMTDLLTFLRAFEEGRLVSAPVHARLTDFTHELEKGVGYGMGVMQFRFSELSPLLFMMSDVHGAVGATGTFALYDPDADVYYVANFGSLGFAQKAIEELVRIRLLVDRLEQ